MSDPENTFRALKDQPLFVERWQCRLGLHRWTKWSDPERKGSHIYYYHHRFCVDCNQYNIQKINTRVL